MRPSLTPAARRRGLLAIFASTFCELTGVFMFAPLLLFSLKAQGLDTASVGLFAAAQWVGLALATPFAGGWVQRLGARNALRTSATAPLLCLLGIVLTTHLEGQPALWLLWALLYLVAGAGAALRWIVAEATVAELAPAQRRGRIVGLFETMVGSTFVLGPLLLAWLLGGDAGGPAELDAALGSAGDSARWLAIALLTLGALLTLPVPALSHAVPAADTSDSASAAAAGPLAADSGWRGLLAAARAAPLVMVAGLIGGFFESGLTSALPLYGLVIGMTAAAAVLLASASGLGSALMMAPLGELADRWHHGRVLRLCAAVNLGATLLLPWVSALGWLAWVVAFSWGAAGGALYTLAMIDIGHRLQGVALVNGTAVLVMSYTVGAALAPSLGGAVLQWSPQIGFPALLAAVALGGLLALRRA